ncbi:MAG: DUF1998 domain-containing protein [Acidobacteriia bacterium]|nr:DUF1998 domain-containing protein [Terriglobia bacterium]
MDEVELPPPEFAQFLVAQSSVQIHDEGGDMFLLRCFESSMALGRAFSATCKQESPGLQKRPDAYPGGVGLSAPLYRLAPRLLEQTAELLAGCRGDAGCPSCVGPVGEVGEHGKEVAARIRAELTA